MGELLDKAQEITHYIVNRVDEIDLVYLYGGVAQGRENPRSDIEMCAVSEEKQIRWEFVLDDSPVFIWPQTWKQLEAISTGKEGIGVLLAGLLLTPRCMHAQTKKEGKMHAKAQSFPLVRFILQVCCRESLDNSVF